MKTFLHPKQEFLNYTDFFIDTFTIKNKKVYEAYIDRDYSYSTGDITLINYKDYIPEDFNSYFEGINREDINNQIKLARTRILKYFKDSSFNLLEFRSKFRKYRTYCSQCVVFLLIEE